MVKPLPISVNEEICQCGYINITPNSRIGARWPKNLHTSKLKHITATCANTLLAWHKTQITMKEIIELLNQTSPARVLFYSATVIVVIWLLVACVAEIAESIFKKK